jgi:hypothetical protein
MHIDFVYVVEIPLSEPLSLRAEEVSLAHWVPSGEIDHIDTYENVKQVCRAISSLSKRAGIASAYEYCEKYAVCSRKK